MSSFELTYNNLTISETDTRYVINKLNGLYGLPLRVSQDDLTGRDGGNIWNSLYSMRMITIEGSILGTSDSNMITNVKALISAFAKTPSALDLTVKMFDGSQRTIPAFVVETPLIEHVGGMPFTTRFLVVLKCTDPFWQDNNESIYTINISTTGGFPVSAVVPLPLSGAPATVNVANTGDVESFAMLTITGNITNPTILNASTGETFQVTTTLVTGDILLVYKDTTGPHVTKNGVNIYDLLSGDIFPMQVGSNVIYFSGTSYDSTATCTINYSNKYLNL